MKLLNMLLGKRPTEGVRGHDDPVGVLATEVVKSRTPEEAKARRKAYKPEEAKARRKAYKKRKAAKAARRRNRK